jgi:hypothetical protein
MPCLVIIHSYLDRIQASNESGLPLSQVNLLRSTSEFNFLNGKSWCGRSSRIDTHMAKVESRLI